MVLCARLFEAHSISLESRDMLYLGFRSTSDPVAGWWRGGCPAVISQQIPNTMPQTSPPDGHHTPSSWCGGLLCHLSQSSFDPVLSNETGARFFSCPCFRTGRLPRLCPQRYGPKSSLVCTMGTTTWILPRTSVVAQNSIDVTCY